MRKIIVCIAVGFTLSSCAGGSAERASGDSTATASDTITNVTNPGVGAASDDTLRRP